MLHEGTPNIITRASILVVLAGVSFGCVDLTRPWEKAGYRSDAGGDTRDGSPGDAASSSDIVDARLLGTERPVDAPQDPPQRDDGGPADTSLDASTDQPAATADVPQSLDGGSDSPVGEVRTEGDAVPNEVGNPGLDAAVLDVSVADTSVEAPASSLDVGGEVAASSGLLASYPCESASGAELRDTSGHGKHAVLANGSGGSTPVGFSFGAGSVGNGLGLSAPDKAYVSLPKGLLAQASAATIATWVKLNAGTAYQRIFDFGADTNTFMYLANASSSGFVRFRIQSASLNKNQVLEGAEAVPVGRWTHVAVTLGDNGVSIFIDGVQVAQQAPAVVRPSDLGDTGNNYIGRSQFASDPYLDGAIDELRIYDRALGVAEIGDLATRPEN